MFVDNVREILDNTKVNDAFNLYFANVEKTLSATFQHRNVLNIDFIHYLQTFKTTSLIFLYITESVMVNTIDKLENIKVVVKMASLIKY